MEQKENQMYLKGLLFGYCLAAGIIFDLLHVPFLGNILILFSLLVVLNTYVFDGLIHKFQNNVLPAIMRQL